VVVDVETSPTREETTTHVKTDRGGSSDSQNGTAGGFKPFSCCSITSSPAASIETASPILACCWRNEVISIYSYNKSETKLRAEDGESRRAGTNLEMVQLPCKRQLNWWENPLFQQTAQTA